MKKIIINIIILSFIFSGNTFAGEFQKGICPSDLIMTQNMKAPRAGTAYVRNGKYHWYTKAVVKEAHILQKHLNRLGFNAGKVDGIIGPLTKGAILRMQKFLGTRQDGYVGPKTRQFLNNSCDKTNLIQKNIKKKNTERNTLDTSFINSIMSRGLTDKITNGDVTRLQKILKDNGYEITVDGIFGWGTENVLKKFTKDKLGKEMLYFDPRLFQEKKEVSEKDYHPQKMNEYLGYGKFDFFYLDFPFSESKINSIYCGKLKKDYIFKNNKIIFPISKNGPGKFTCKLSAKLDNEDKTFEILDVYFRTVKRATTKVNLIKKYATGPSTELQKRIAKERLMLKEIYKKSDSSIKFNSSFIKPMETKMISEFGKVRIFNNGRRSVHSGTDYRAQTPLPVKVINDGEVILANVDLYYCGKGVVVNHGMNIFSTYCHLSENKVSTGDKVKKGDIIGLTGSTGRVSGPHLHLSVKYNGGYVDFEELQKKSEISLK